MTLLSRYSSLSRLSDSEIINRVLHDLEDPKEAYELAVELAKRLEQANKDLEQAYESMNDNSLFRESYTPIND